jgi:hypothetical protein
VASDPPQSGVERETAAEAIRRSLGQLSGASDHFETDKALALCSNER